MKRIIKSYCRCTINLRGYSLFLGLLILNVASVNIPINFVSAQNPPMSPFESSSNLPGFAFAAVGDMGCSSTVKRIVNDISNKFPKVILALGDLSYQPRKADCWFNLISPIDNRMKIALGGSRLQFRFFIKTVQESFQPKSRVLFL